MIKTSKNIIYAFLIIGFSFSCKAQRNSVSKPEDLSLYRIRFKDSLSIIKPESEKNQQMVLKNSTDGKNSIYKNNSTDKALKNLNTLVESSKKNKKANGYRVQAYKGNDKEKLINLKKSIYTDLQIYDVYMENTPPIFTLKVGNYIYKQDAYKILGEILRFNPDAIVINDLIDLK